jgi:sugar phosphate isomerase/epimerase
MIALPRQMTSNSFNLSRRTFIKTSTHLALAAGALGAGLGGLAAEKRRPWTVAIRDGHLKATGQPDCWSALKFLGASGLELQVNDAMLCPGLHHPARQYTAATADGIKLLKDDLAAAGVAVTALCMSNHLDERLDQEIGWARKAVAAAQAFGATAIRIDVVPRKVPLDQFLPFAIKACRQLCEVADGTPVRFGIENHGRFSNNPTALEKLFDGVGSSRLGLTLDVMNFYWFGHPLNEVYGICQKFASRAFHTHCKNLRYPEEKKNVSRPIGWEYDKHAVPLYEGDIDYRRVAAILRETGYQGDLCLENECLKPFPKEQHPEILRKEVALLKTLAA